jgi:hypothetical protein
MEATASRRRTSPVTRLLLATLVFLVALSGLSSAHASMSPVMGASAHSETDVVTAVQLHDRPQSRGAMPSVDSTERPTFPNCCDMCPDGCAVASACALGLATLSGVSTNFPGPALSIRPTIAPLPGGMTARILTPERPPSLTALSISRI